MSPSPTSWRPTPTAWPTSLEAVPTEGWHEEGHEERSVLATARRAVHEGNHHLLDIGRVLRAVREQSKDD